MKAYIYKKTLNITGKSYIGQHNGNDPNYYGSGVDWKKDIKEHNIDWVKDITTEILEYVEDISKLDEREKYWLEYFDAANNPLFYNKTNKPFGPITHSKKTRTIISLKNKGKKREGEALNNLRKGHKKRILNIDGEKITKSKKGHNCYKNPERGKKISISNKGRKDTEETKYKKSQALLGKSTKPKKQIKEYDLENNLVKIWPSVTELISYYKKNNLGFDYATFLKKQKENKSYKNRYWNE
jgi:hypothetical protein